MRMAVARIEAIGLQRASRNERRLEAECAGQRL
jgi:hypothetical protein